MCICFPSSSSVGWFHGSWMKVMISVQPFLQPVGSVGALSWGCQLAGWGVIFWQPSTVLLKRLSRGSSETLQSGMQSKKSKKKEKAICMVWPGGVKWELAGKNKPLLGMKEECSAILPSLSVASNCDELPANMQPLVKLVESGFNGFLFFPSGMKYLQLGGMDNIVFPLGSASLSPEEWSFVMIPSSVPADTVRCGVCWVLPIKVVDVLVTPECDVLCYSVDEGRCEGYYAAPCEWSSGEVYVNPISYHKLEGL